MDFFSPTGSVRRILSVPRGRMKYKLYNELKTQAYKMCSCCSNFSIICSDLNKFESRTPSHLVLMCISRYMLQEVLSYMLLKCDYHSQAIVYHSKNLSFLLSLMFNATRKQSAKDPSSHPLYR